MRRATVFAALIVALAAVAWVTYTALEPSGSSAAPPAANGLACSVKPADPGCVGDEVEVFRMSSTANAHAGTSSGSTYPNVVCCGGVVSLATSCSRLYETVLTLSAADNAHVASDGSYPVGVCLSVSPLGTLDCEYDTACDAGYACLATISGGTNAHVADCGGVDAYATKVCCQANPPIPVGGIAQLPEASGSSAPDYLALAALAAAGLFALIAAAWYARRRLS
jgi:hypothetical protein